MVMTFSQYDSKIEQLTTIENNQKGRYPTLQEIDNKLLPSFNDETLMYFLWLTETAGVPSTPEAAEGEKKIRQILRENIELIDDEGNENE